MAARHHPDLVMCRKQPGTSVGKLCERCEGKCVICDSYVRPHTAVRLCAECDFGTFAGRCTLCGGPGVSDAYYCKECVQQEKDVRWGEAALLRARAVLAAACGSLLVAPVYGRMTLTGPPISLLSLSLTHTPAHASHMQNPAEGWLPKGH